MKRFLKDLSLWLSGAVWPITGAGEDAANLRMATSELVRRQSPCMQKRCPAIPMTHTKGSEG